MQTYAPVRIGPKRFKTPEGFLLCKDVQLARTGIMYYGPDELKNADGSRMFEPGPDGRVAIERLPDVVFHRDTLDSFVGKSITIKHPSKIVDPKSWQNDSHGTILNTRRGEGLLSDFMVGDILVTTEEAINAVESLREVSCGYDAAYEKISPGVGRQTKIVGNHLALVERGRCGPNCYVGDQDMSVTEEPEEMTTKPAFPGLDAFKRLLGATTADEANKIIADVEQAEKTAATADALAKLTTDVASLAETVAKLATKDEGEKIDLENEKVATTDAATFDAMPLHPRIVTAAEILSPGFAVPTFDATTTQDQVCACQKDALAKAYATDAGKKAIDIVTAGMFAPDTMTADQISAAFFAGSHMIGLSNNGALAAITASMGAGGQAMSQIERNEAAQKRADERNAARREAMNKHH